MAEFWTDYAAKQQINKTAWAVGLPGYLFFLVSTFLGTIVVFLGQAAGFSTKQISDFVSDPAAGQLVEIGLSIILMTFPFILAAKIAGYNISSSAGFKKPKEKTVLPYLIFGVGFCAFANIVVNLAGELFKRFGVDYSINKGADPEGVSGFLLVILSTAVVPGLLEEFAFRGIILGMLRPYGDAFAVIASSVVFGLLHGNFEQIPFALLVGLALGFIRVKSDSIVVPMAVHAINNLIAVLISKVNMLPREWVSLSYTLYVLFALVASVLGVMLLKNKGEFSFPKTERKVSAGKVYRYFFLSPAIILLSILFIARAIWFML